MYHNSGYYTDNLPIPGITVASPANASTTCTDGTITAVPGTAVISYIGGSVSANASCTVSVDVIGTSVGQNDNISGELTFSYPTVTCGIATASLTVAIDPISLTKNFTDDPVAPGGTVNLQFVITNLNRNFPASDIGFTDDLDALLTGLVATGLPLDDACGAGSQLTGTDFLTLTGGNLPAEGSCTFDVTLSVPAGAVPGQWHLL